MTFEVLFNGTGDAFSVAQFGTNFLCRCDDFILAVDCPDSYRRALSENAFELDGAALTVDDIDAMFITHLHGDHVNGLEMVLAYRKFVTKRPLPLYTTPEVAAVIWESRLRVSLGTLFDGESYHTMTLADFASLHSVAWQTETAIGPITVETRRTIHHIPTSALRISYGGKTLGYSCDTAFDPSLVEWLETADHILSGR